MFGGLLGGGCCDKDNVFLGLVACKEDEKKLA
ncbi:TPA: mating pair stabilization protein, partial [Campylobacter coli]|nr:mating pair stabilization protein [Campylobacter coli]